MKLVLSVVGLFIAPYITGCTFHPPTMSDVFDQTRLINNEKVALRECERNSGAIASITQCQQRAKSWRVTGQEASPIQNIKNFETK